MSLWEDKRYVDLWSIVHFLSGVLLYGVFWWLEFELVPAFAISILLIIFWEVFEYLIKILEPSPNVAIDIIVAIVGFFVPPLLAKSALEIDAVGYLYLAGITLLLAIWGFLKWLKRERNIS